MFVSYPQRQGTGTLTSATEGVYEGTWEKDMRHGKGKLTYPNGDVYEGDWELSKVLFEFTVFHENCRQGS